MGCASSPSGTPCGTRCADKTHAGPASCDGLGTCVAVDASDCAPYNCNDDAGTCWAVCSTDSDCSEGECLDGGTCCADCSPCGHVTNRACQCGLTCACTNISPGCQTDGCQGNLACNGKAADETGCALRLCDDAGAPCGDGGTCQCVGGGCDGGALCVCK
jgi:hypothetical protein